MNVWMSLVVFLRYFSYVFCCSLIWVMLGNVMDWHAEGVGMVYVQISNCLSSYTYLYHSTHDIYVEE